MASVDAAAAGFLLILDVAGQRRHRRAAAGAARRAEAAPARVGAQPLPRSRCHGRPRTRGAGLESADWLESTWHELGDLVDFAARRALARRAASPRCPGAAIEAIVEVGRPGSCTSAWTSRPSGPERDRWPSARASRVRRSSAADHAAGAGGDGRSTGCSGVGPKKLEGLQSLGIDDLYDLLTHYPRRYVDRTREARIAELAPGEEALVLGRVSSVSSRRVRRRPGRW